MTTWSAAFRMPMALSLYSLRSRRVIRINKKDLVPEA